MLCCKCKKENPDGALFCAWCGIKQQPKEKRKYTYERVTFYHDGIRYEVTGRTLAEAYEKVAERKLALKNGEIGVNSNMTVKRWAMEWLEAYKQPLVGEGQYSNYLTHINGVILPAIGSKKLKDVKDIDLQKILNSRTGKSKSDLSRLRGTIKAMFKQARVSRLITYDPAEELKLPTAKDGTHRSITPEERTIILSLANEHYAGLWIKTLLYCGLRPGETRALNWQHVDLKANLIRIEQAMKAGSNEIGTPKSASGVRLVPIPEQLAKELSVHRGTPLAPVFTQPTTGKRHTKSSMNCLWKSFKRELDIRNGATVYRNQIISSTLAEDLVPYCLRHTYGTDLQDAGISINVAKYLMGHSDIKVTANVYTHTTQAALDEVAKKMGNYHQKKLCP